MGKAVALPIFVYALLLNFLCKSGSLVLERQEYEYGYKNIWEAAY
jgi:hypothetical protein